MTLESDAKFEEKLTLDLKNDMMNLVNFNASSGWSENLNLYVLLLSIAYKVSAEKRQKSYLSWHWRMIQNLKKRSLFVWKMTWEIWWILTRAWDILTRAFDGIFLSNVCNVWAKIIQTGCVVKMAYGFKNNIRNLVNFYTSSWK